MGDDRQKVLADAEGNEKTNYNQINMNDGNVTQTTSTTGEVTTTGLPSGGDVDPKTDDTGYFEGKDPVPSVDKMGTDETGGNDDPKVDPDPVNDNAEEYMPDRVKDIADKTLKYETYKAKQEAIARRAKVRDENQKSIEKFFSENLNNAAMVDKFGWTGGAKMDSATRMQYLQSSLNADMYSREMLAQAELDNNMAIAREYASLKKSELAQQAWQHAEEMAITREQVTGQYISPVMQDMLSQYEMAMLDEDTERSEQVMGRIEGMLEAMGYGEEVKNELGEVVTDEDGNPQRSVDPAVIDGLFYNLKTLEERRVEVKEYAQELAKEAADFELELREGVDMTGDGLQAGNSPSHGFKTDAKSEDGSPRWWNAVEEKWQSREEFDEWTVDNQPTDPQEEEQSDAGPTLGEKRTVETEEGEVEEVFDGSEWTQDEESVPSNYGEILDNSTNHFAELIENARVPGLSFKGMDKEPLNSTQKSELSKTWSESEFNNNNDFLRAALNGRITAISQTDTKFGKGEYNDEYTVSYRDKDGNRQTTVLQGADLLVGSLALDTNFGYKDILETIKPSAVMAGNKWKALEYLMHGASIPDKGPNSDDDDQDPLSGGASSSGGSTSGGGGGSGRTIESVF